MRYLKCKCGKREMWTTDGVWDCQGCEECGTTYSGHPDGHKPLQPHEWGILYNQNTGKPYKHCIHCYHIDQESYKESNEKSDDPWKDILAAHGIDKNNIVFTPPPKEEGRIDEIPEDEVPIPKNLDEALEMLDNEENRKFAKEHQENDFLCELHFSIGMKLRNDWELWHGSTLAKWFNEKGIYHADDMSSIILLAYYRKVNGEDIKLDKQIKEYRDYWDKQIKEYRDYWDKVDPDVNKGVI